MLAGCDKDLAQSITVCSAVSTDPTFTSTAVALFCNSVSACSICCRLTKSLLETSKACPMDFMICLPNFDRAKMQSKL